MSSVLKSDGIVNYIAAKLHKADPVSELSDVLFNLLKLFSARYGNNSSLRIRRARFYCPCSILCGQITIRIA